MNLSQLIRTSYFSMQTVRHARSNWWNGKIVFKLLSRSINCKLFQVAIMTLCAISVDRYNVIVYPLNPSRSTTNMRSKLMILFVWLYSLPFCGIKFVKFHSILVTILCSFGSLSVLPFLGIWGVAGYQPEGFLTACSFDYLDTSPSNYWFIFVYAMVSTGNVHITHEQSLYRPALNQAAYFLPLVIIAYCYFHILHVVVSAKKIQSSKEKNKTELRLAAIVMGIIGLVSGNMFH